MQKLYKSELVGPEAFHLWKNEIYTSLATGEIVKFSTEGHLTFVTKIGKKCDAYLGIWRVDLRNDNQEMLVSPHIPINGKTPKLFNSVALDKNDGLYWTDSSTEYHLNDGVFASISDPSGRLIYYNFSTKENKVLIDNLWFPNGIIISPDHSFIVGTFGSAGMFSPGVSGIILADWSGNIFAAYYNSDGSVSHISDAIVYNDTLLIGSPSAQYIGAVPAPDLLKKAYLSKDVNISEKESKTNE
ncbi:unnamed protein product [Leptidea sinapis]|uniref:Strictosidine synthase conserved region domain-containing protein n=1 Tax=Leptidea sinapis TaxID=189913 RepID=A0A5E4PZS9_9NEOP|nr:unnamed protein product [Leptidea sinapis]